MFIKQMEKKHIIQGQWILQDAYVQKLEKLDLLQLKSQPGNRREGETILFGFVIFFSY